MMVLMDWQSIKDQLEKTKTTFDKYVSQNREVQQGTLNSYAQIMVECFNEARQLIHKGNQGPIKDI